MSTIGIILAIVGLIIYLLRPQLAEENVFEGDRKVRSKAPPFLLMFSKKLSTSILVAGTPLKSLIGAAMVKPLLDSKSGFTKLKKMLLGIIRGALHYQLLAN
ncbi:MAG: hypothetical protein ABJF11_08905 [Reichenbachiella sp.]|uniref:hypothetical protein n=1 Tax=Reichenbachiella sp. TaxID=2184521 RepID=UPI0032661725